MAYYGFFLLIAGCVFSGFVSCHAVKDAERDAKRVANFINSIKTAPIVKQNSPIADQKSSVTRKNVILTDPTDVLAVETTVAIPAEANMEAVDIIVEPAQIDSNNQKSKLSDPVQSNTLSTAENTPSETVASARESFIVPTNNIQLPESGSVVAVESSPNKPVTNGQSLEVTEKVKELVPSPTMTSTTMNSIGTSKLSISSSSAEATPGQATASERSAVTLLPDAVAASDVTTEGFNSTQGTIAPSVTNIVDKSTDDDVIVFQSNKNGDNKQASTFITTTSALTTDTLAMTEKTTTPKRKTTLNVIKPTTSGTTELAQTVPLNQPEAAEAKMTVDTITEAKADPKPAQDNAAATMTTAGETANMASFVEEITNDKTTPSAEVSKLSGDSMISTKSDPAATKISTTVSELAREYNAQTTEENNAQTTEENQTKQPVSTSTVGTNASVTVQTNEITCPDILCTGSCKYGRKRDTRGCETCQCNSDCPKPVPTTRLLCMMQLRLGQSCRSDADCPLHRICCPGTCGQSCRRRSSTRSRVLSMLRNL